VNGWFWADGNKRIPPTNTPSRLTFWSRTGEAGKPQPDNFEGLKAGLAIENPPKKPPKKPTKNVFLGFLKFLIF
jgi:hypothetical protein